MDENVVFSGDNKEESRNFYHNGTVYIFKWEKLKYILNGMEPGGKLRGNLIAFFKLIISKRFPDEIFNNPKVMRCSSFKLEYLQRGFIPKISKILVQKGYVHEFKIIENGDKNKNKNKETSQIPQFIKDLSFFARKKYYFHKQENYIKPSHDAVLNEILLISDNSISLETPVWTKSQMNLDKFISPKKNELLNFNHSHTISGHIDLLMYDDINKTLVVVDYKPEGNFLRSLPQVATYGLILKHILRLDQIYCSSFNKDYVWYYNPTILQDVIEKEIIKNHSKKELSNLSKKLKWRKIIKNL